MKVRGFLAVGICLLGATAGWAQALPTAATIESIPLELTMPEKYHVTAVLEPIRRVSLVAPADGVIRSIATPLGDTVRASQEIAQLDRAEASARLKVAQAEVKEKQAMLKSANQTYQAFYAAQLEAAQAKVELAQLELSRLTLSAPFAGRIIALPVSSGQYVMKGSVIAELADLTSLKSLVPVDRRTVSEGSDAQVFVEEQARTAKIQSVLPLPETYASLRDLAAPFASAWVVISNTKGDLAPGLRVRSATLPITPLATVPKDSIKTTEGAGASAGSMVQVLRNEYVTNVPVSMLGKVGAERMQVTGALRTTDALIVSSSVALLPGTLVRFSGSTNTAIEGTTPNPARQGAPAGISPPPAASSSTDSFGGPTSPRSATPKRRARNTAPPPPAQSNTPF
ncbi:MAG: efflux RND transporter periplasmic adaptor subunit [Isosphaeraceae bacterium]